MTGELTSAELKELIPLGSEWYAWGDHIVVTEYGERDGELTVFTSARRAGRLVKIPVSVAGRILLKKGVRKDA